MYENSTNSDLKEKIKAVIIQSKGNNAEILKILINELKGIKLSENSKISYCSCGYPISYEKDKKKEWIEEILKLEVDFRSYREYYNCPNCDKLLAEFQR